MWRENIHKLKKKNIEITEEIIVKIIQTFNK
jgi:hypothetical protein